MTVKKPIVSADKSEQIVIGICLLYRDSFWNVSEMLKPEMFLSAFLSRVFSVIRDLITEGGNVSPVTVERRIDALTPDGKLTSATLAAYMSEAEDQAQFIYEYAGEIVDAWMRRQAINILEKQRKMLETPGRRPEETIAAAVADLTDISGQTNHGDVSLHLSAVEVVREAEEAYKSDKNIGMSYGIQTFDELFGPMLPGMLINLMADSGAGKTCLALNIACHVSQTEPVEFIQREMTHQQMTRRFLAARVGISTRDIAQGNITGDGDFARLLQEADGARNYRLDIRDKGLKTVSDVVAAIMQKKRQGGVSLVILDHLQRMKDSRGRDLDLDSLGSAMSDLKECAKDAGVAMMVLTQRKRGAKERPDPFPRKNDGFGGDRLVQESDVIIGLFSRYSFLQNLSPQDPAYRYLTTKEGFNSIPDEEREDVNAESRLSYEKTYWESRREVAALKVRDGYEGAKRIIYFNGERQQFYDRHSR